MAVRVFHCDDSEAFRVLVAELLRDEPGIEVVGQAGDGVGALAGVRATGPDVVLLDLRGAGLGTELIAALRASAPQPAIVVVSGWDGPIGQHDVAARLSKGVSAQELADAIRAAAAGRRMTDGGESPSP